MSERYSDFKKAGAQIIAINAEDSNQQHDFRKSKNIEYMFLSDSGAATAKKFGVYNEPDPAHITPSIFIIDGKGVIRWMYVGKNANDRPQPDTVLEALKKIR